MEKKNNFIVTVQVSNAIYKFEGCEKCNEY